MLTGIWLTLELRQLPSGAGRPSEPEEQDATEQPAPVGSPQEQFAEQTSSLILHLFFRFDGDTLGTTTLDKAIITVLAT